MNALPEKDLTTLATEINREHEAAEGAINMALGHARAAGDLLNQAKAQLRHGEWADWLASNFRGSARTARPNGRKAGGRSRTCRSR